MPAETKGRIAKLDKFTGNDGCGSMEDAGKWRNPVAAWPPDRLNWEFGAKAGTLVYPLHPLEPSCGRKQRVPVRTNITRFWSQVMAQVCEVCGKGPQFGNNVSHAHNVTRRRWNVNLRPVKAKVNGAARRLRVCTNCIKSGKITKA